MFFSSRAGEHSDGLLAQALLHFFHHTAPEEAQSANVSSIQVNRYATDQDAAKLHRDGNNLGPSWIAALGEFEGGQLWTLEKGVLPVKGQWQQFDGRDYHATLPFSGGPRYSLVFYCLGTHANLSEGEKDSAKLLGFSFPGPADPTPPPRSVTSETAARSSFEQALSELRVPETPPAYA